ncbi:GntR family transcriptional regulator [Streptomyces sp. NPDC059783]|uniref:GntR family transcriptional regulator n=1 Tax=Streptomyces sp. NPDC059783 TaxID=3346944 RepID=UPI003658BCDF
MRERIADGTIKPGRPVVSALLREFDVRRSVLLNALAPLHKEGLLTYRRGGSSFVPGLPEGPERGSRAR